MELGTGVELAWAFAQPLTAIHKAEMQTAFFAETPCIPTEFALKETNTILDTTGQTERRGNLTLFRGLTTGTSPILSAWNSK